MHTDHNPTPRTGLDLAALLRPTSPTTPMEAVEALIVGLGLPSDPDLDRFIEAEITAERARIAASQKLVGRNGGTHFGGMEAEAWPVREPERLVADARARKVKREGFLASPRGRFLKATFDLGTLGWNEAEAVRAIYARRFANEDEALDVEAVGRCIRLLADIDHSDARAAIGALADLLAPQLAKAA